MGKTERIHHQSRNNPVPCLCSNVVPWWIRIHKWRIRTCRRQCRQLTCSNRWIYRTNLCTTWIWRVAASSSFSFRIHSKRSNRFNNGCTCERSREPVRRYCNSSSGYSELVPKCSSSIFIPVIQPVRFPLSGSHSNDGTADAV